MLTKLCNPKNDGIILAFPPDNNDSKLNSDKLINWIDFEESCRKFSLHIGLEFEKDAHLILLTCEKWLIARRFLIKKEWNSKTKIHPKRKVVNELKPLGDLLISYWNLCERCHSYSSNTDLSVFANTADLFSRVFIDVVAIDLAHCFYPPQKLYYANKKLAWVEIERERLRTMKKLNNPFYKYAEAIGLKILIDSAINIASNSDQFSKDFWKPYLKNYGQYIKSLEHGEWRRVYADNNKCYLKTSSGKIFLGQTEAAKKTLF